MRRFAIIFLIFTMIFTTVGCANELENEPVQTTTTPSESIAEAQVCVEHDFIVATLSRPAHCSKCDATEGEPLYKQCETWEDVVNCLYFDDLLYDLTVTEDENCVTLVLEFTNANQFATEDQVKEFMVKAIVSLPDIIGFTQGSYLGVSVDTPDCFRKDATVFLAIPGGTIGCVPYDGNLFGFATCLIPDELSANVTALKSAYDVAFGYTNVEYELE